MAQPSPIVTGLRKDSPADYIPEDRRASLARGMALPDRQTGSAVFADISGFTPLTARLAASMGLRRGAEELPVHLERVYEALIAEVSARGGSVIGFAGDAITCWFDGDEGARAVASAFAMQSAMGATGRIELADGETLTLGLKVAVATGPVRRMIVGDPDIQLHDVIGGRTVERLAAGEQLAAAGEVIVDEATAASLAGLLTVGEWRAEPEAGRFAVAVAVAGLPEAEAVPDRTQEVPSDSARPWLIPEVFARMEAGQGEFLTELRPVTVVFVGFTGTDFDADPEAPAKLDGFVRRVQAEAARLQGTLLQLTVGDKGNYLYLGFGAPVSNEDDVPRAVIAALRLRGLSGEFDFISNLRIGVSQGIMRTGAYGGHGRRTYGALGEETNLAARLMSSAAEGQILVTRPVFEAAGAAFDWLEHEEITVKGRDLPLAVFEPVGVPSAAGTATARHRDALIGRTAELELLHGELDLAGSGAIRVVRVSGEAGIGKTHLITALTSAAGTAATTLVGEAESYTTDSPYYPWRSILWGLLGRSEGNDAAAHLAERLAEVSPELPARLPLLTPVLNLALPDTDLTASLDPELRKAARESLVLELIRYQAQRAGAAGRTLLLVLEDLQWFDSLSTELLESVIRGLEDLPVMLVTSHRDDWSATGTVAAKAVQIRLGSLNAAEAKELVHRRLQAAEQARELPDEAVSRLLEQADGNPYYLEELADYVATIGAGQEAEQKGEWPTGLQSLILSRIDRLGEHRQAMLKAASVIGRRFGLQWLDGYYPSLGGLGRLSTAAAELSRLDLTVPEDGPAGRYAFRQAITRDVTYGSIPFAVRSDLHERLGAFIEEHVATEQAPMLEVLAFHHGLGGNTGKQRHYFRLAGEAAQEAYANEAALNWFARLLPLALPEERSGLLARRGQVLMHIGAYAEARQSFTEAIEAARQAGDRVEEARAMRLSGELFEKQGDYPGAVSWLEQARSALKDLDDKSELVQVLLALGGNVLWQQGEYATARQWLEQALELAGSSGDARSVARARHGLGNIELHQGNLESARRLFDKSLVARREINDSLGIANALNNLGIIAASLDGPERARELFAESLSIRRKIGDRAGSAVALNNLGFMEGEAGDPEAALGLYASSLALRQELGDRTGSAVTLNSLGHLEFTNGRPAGAARHFAEGLRIADEIGNTREAAAAMTGVAVLGAAGQPAQALRLASAAQAQLERIEAAMEPEVQAMYEQAVEQARASLGPEAYEAEVLAGTELDTAGAVRLGLRLAASFASAHDSSPE